MATTIQFEDEILKLLFNATSIPGLADDAATTPETELFVGLHTEDPARAASPNQTAGEITYTGYTRMAVPRTEVGWEVAGGKVIPADIIEFAEVTGVTGQPRVAMYFSVGTDVSGVGKLMFTGKLNPSITISNGATPRIDNQSVASRMEDTWA